MTKEKMDLMTYLREVTPRQMVDLSVRFEESGLPANFKPTLAFRTVVERFNYAREVKAALALITGAHGAGKTTALRYIAHHEDVLFWECKPGYQAKHVLLDIAQRLGINTGQGWQMQTSITAEQMAENPRIFLLDEAQRLDYAGMDLLKYLADFSGSTFVLSASPSLEKRIDRWPDIASRCSVRARVATISAEEFVELYQADGFTPETLVELHRLSKGVMRTVQALLREIDMHLAAFNERSGLNRTRKDFEPGHIRAIAEKVVG
jgi:DNA transposition AAA+ family ATPase